MNALCDATCEATQPSAIVGPTNIAPFKRHWRSRFYHYAQVVAHGVLFVGGGTLIVVNATAALELPPTLSSVVSGIGLMVQQVEKIEEVTKIEGEHASGQASEA